MIAIVRVTQRGHPHPFGEQGYEVRINATVIATFRHKREDGLVMCLTRAAAAVQIQEWEDYKAFLDRNTAPLGGW